MTNAVEVRHLSKSIEGSPILNDICMSVKQGEIYGFLGANGAGKTSLDYFAAGDPERNFVPLH